MTPIANCKGEFAFQCPKSWSKLKKTENADIRFCKVCSRNVYFCNSWEDIHHNASRGNCIAIPPEENNGLVIMGEPIPDYSNPKD